MTLKALDTIKESEVVIGFKTYMNLIEDLLEGKEIISSAMMKEKDRSKQAVEIAAQGKKVAVISSGDAGVFGMAGIVLETLDHLGLNDQVDVEMIPGVTAANAAAASLGAPLMHDFAVISLSDLLTPWDVIVKRVHAAASGDLIVSLYNPKSKKRVTQIEEVQKIFLEYKSPDTPVGIVRNAKRGDEEVVLSTLGEFTNCHIDMFTLVVIGNSQTKIIGGRMVTPRGYVL